MDLQIVHCPTQSVNLSISSEMWVATQLFAKSVNPSIQLLFAEYMLGIVYRAIYILWLLKASPQIGLRAQKDVPRVGLEALLCIAQKNLSIYPYPQKSEWPHNFFAKTVNPSIQLLLIEHMLGIVYWAIYILWLLKASPHIGLQAQKGADYRVKFEALCFLFFC